MCLSGCSRAEICVRMSLYRQSVVVFGPFSAVAVLRPRALRVRTARQCRMRSHHGLDRHTGLSRRRRRAPSPIREAMDRGHGVGSGTGVSGPEPDTPVRVASPTVDTDDGTRRRSDAFARNVGTRTRHRCPEPWMTGRVGKAERHRRTPRSCRGSRPAPARTPARAGPMAGRRHGVRSSHRCRAENRCGHDAAGQVGCPWYAPHTVHRFGDVTAGTGPGD